ncbi:MAG: hypothetical protein GEU94_11385 [Micromonosporaceae bacterium]|nr:hypothetical protein [Micromonosporaceae bacterium]
MTAGAQAPEPDTPAPVPCAACSGPIVQTVLGWMHLTEHGIPATGWLCPMPQMHIAKPRPSPTPAAPPSPPAKRSPRSGHLADW